LAAFPRFRGRLIDSESVCAALAQNFGRLPQQKPSLVMEPGCVEDVARLLKFASPNGIPVAARGQGHSTYRQTEVAGGVLVQMRELARVREISREHAWVDAGLRWSALLEQTLPLGLTPPTLTDYLHLSVGGTLSVGGIGGETHRCGAQVDNVLELEVVTGLGEMTRCSRSLNPELFDACRAGLGQVAVITGARIPLIPARESVRTFKLAYDNLEALLTDLTSLAATGDLDHLYANITQRGARGWDYEMVATRGASPRTTRDEEAPLAVARHAVRVASCEMSYRDFAHRVDGYADWMRATGAWDLPHPWFDVFLPASRAAPAIARELDRLTPDQLGAGGILLYPVRRSRSSAPLLRLPSEEHTFLFDVLRNGSDDPLRTQGLVEANGRSYRELVQEGATLYPIGATPMSAADWAHHFGAAWPSFASAKRRFDPYGILTPGQGVFCASA
jgi:FAD/FMN-containing dehydrogenase